jgi:hypothetical protein
LLTKINVNIPNGTVLKIKNDKGIDSIWLVWWKENIEASGYNKYCVLKTNRILKWNLDGVEHTQQMFF